MIAGSGTFHFSQLSPKAASAIRPELPRLADEVIARSLALRPEDRYPSAPALIEAIAKVEAALAAPPAPVEPGSRTEPFAREKPAPALPVPTEPPGRQDAGGALPAPGAPAAPEEIICVAIL